MHEFVVISELSLTHFLRKHYINAAIWRNVLGDYLRMDSEPVFSIASGKTY